MVTAREWTPTELESARSMRASGSSWTSIAGKLNRSADSVRNKLRYTQDDASVAKPVPAEEESSFTDSGETASLECKLRKRVMSVEDALAAGNVDQTVWRVKEYTINKWEMGYVSRENEANVIPLWQVKVRLERIVKKCYSDAAELYVSRFKTLPRIKTAPPMKRGNRLLVMCLFDAHLGKLAWELETGTNQDTNIQRVVYRNAVADLIKIAGGGYDRILFPIGNDFFQADNWLGQTAKGTVVDHDGRFAKVFTAGKEEVTNAIEMCLEVAPVDVVYIPGNHDMATSFYLTCCIEGRFHGNKHVNVNRDPASRKYYRYGTNLIGMVHSDEEKIDDLHGLMALERPMDFAETSTHEWLTGHYHKKRKFTTKDTDEKMGTTIWTCASLSGTDVWHYRKGFVGCHRAAEAYVYDFDGGHAGYWSVKARA